MTAVSTEKDAAKPASGEPLVVVENLVKHFPIQKGLLKRTVGQVRAVDGVSFTINKGETVGLVGESGSGKSTVARLILRLMKPTSGRVDFGGQDMATIGTKQLRPLRQDIQMVFQDPFSSINPRMTIANAISEPLVTHKLITSTSGRRARVGELLELVGLSPNDMDKYPHQFSGGQAQRIGIARALATNPQLIVADEAVSSLDVSVQAQVLNLLRRLQRELGVSYLFIGHDLNVVRYISDKVCVMYMGQIVESGPADDLMSNPQHPYTEALVGAIASAEYTADRGHGRVVARGEIPSPSNPPKGCRFHTRCPFAFDRCKVDEPALLQVGTDRLAACHLREKMEVSA
ncbi:MAG: dipeptide transporter ATP-binding protein [Pseudonocardiales bacterium]|nr:dipeptide transporter ATP-binding protein [Jatrophihabitantaceae bacterium]MCW2603090.1 dipeptide transporter ATP-binding protein [Pseudonocardiales bacterium]